MLFSLDIMKEYKRVSKTKHNHRFAWLETLLDKYGSYDKIPNNHCKQPCKCYSIKPFEICNNKRLTDEYFSYIDYDIAANVYSGLYQTLIYKWQSSIDKYNDIIQKK
ncbi:hypothetical protein CDIK_0865 [Cucumispora dikerogammari]|nr:hypothetical protein CDIK_0865 [Cucumispora dikerogammari]